VGNEGDAALTPRASLVREGSTAGSGENGGGITVTPDGGGGGSATSGGGTALPGSTPDPVTGNSSSITEDVSEPFQVSVLDNQAGVVLYPNVDQFATLNGWMDLVAQVSGATVASYSWNTTGLPANTISGGSTDQLSFRWDSTNEEGTGYVTSLTLSVTDTSSQTLTYTYDFWIPETSPSVSGSGGGTPATWATSLAPSQELLSAPALGSDDASVDALSGSLGTEIDLPSYNESDHVNRDRSDHDNRWAVCVMMIGLRTGGLFSSGFCDALGWGEARVAVLHQRRINGTSRPSLWQRSMAA
jgi:hypothetical protein